MNDHPPIRPVILTGASGFIAKHVAVALLNAGHAVRGTLRDPARGAEVRAAVAPLLSDPAGLDDRLTFARADLSSDAGWAAAMAGGGALIHTASPFPLTQPKNREALIRPAVDGTRRALSAAHAAGIGRVVMTSSTVAISAAPLPPGRTAYDETVWSDPEGPLANAYAASKTLAERAAWDFAAAHPDLMLTVINPTLVLGPPTDAAYGTSLRLVERILMAKDPMLPRISFGVVDVRDVALAHLRALERPGTAGERFLLADDTLWFRDLALAIRDAMPERKVVTREAPNALIRFLSLFDPSIRTILPTLGRFERLDGSKAGRMLGIDYRPARTAVTDAARWIVTNRRV
jgi:dihydroflavonol-4-reductase